jgi:hypothetical protein
MRIKGKANNRIALFLHGLEHLLAPNSTPKRKRAGKPFGPGPETERALDNYALPCIGAPGFSGPGLFADAGKQSSEFLCMFDVPFRLIPC